MPQEDASNETPEKRPQFGERHFEGHLSVSTGDLYYREFGTGDDILVGLHGGPGAPHDYLAPLADLAGPDWTVYLYDQFGCGRSDMPADTVYDYYTASEYRDRLDEVREAIETDRMHLYGQSWGGWLALEYVLEYPDRVASLVLANTSASTQRAAETMWDAALSSIPQDERGEFEELVAGREFDDDAFEEYKETFREEHVNRSDADPKEFAPPRNPDIYGVMWGPSEFVLADTARLRDWEVTDRLHEIECPTLVISGEYDEIAPELGAELAEKIPNGRFVEFDDTSHVPLWEVREAHTEAVRDFLDSVT